MKFKITIDNVIGGISPSLYRGKAGQFNTSIGIDPDKPQQSGSTIKTSGVLMPSAYTDFTGAALTGYAKWITTNPHDSNIYVYASDGEFLSYNSAFGSETDIGTPTSGIGNGMAYYNNFIYLATPTDISRYGPLDNSPSLANTFWTSTLSLAALGNPTYPTQRQVLLPNHPMHVHNDNKLYIGDFETSTSSANEGRGKISYIRTNSGTDEGDTNDGSAENVFFLPPSYAPVDIESWGTDLVIAAIPMSTVGINNTIAQGKAKLFFWDAVNAPSLPYRVVDLPDPTCTALLNHNGNLFIWSGNMNNGVRVSRYLGGYKTEQLAFFEEGFSPPAGAVEGLGNRVVWGAFTTYPENSACVYSLGYKDANLPLALHNIVNTDAAASSTQGMVTAIRYAQHASFIDPRFIVGWRDNTNFGIDQLSSTANVAVWRSLLYAVGAPFRINKVTIPLTTAVASNHTLIPTLFVDDENTSTALTTINSTNYANSERRIVYHPNVQGNNNFDLQLRWSGTSIIGVSMPIIIEGETLTDATG